ncbi:MAG: 4-hydroxyacetophenone monooxygenase [Robiginitomaculum sp.]|nr:MAG: 4-hydroxyacetophenone monooxygenase [Robiginitomaculum sp.]
MSKPVLTALIIGAGFAGVCSAIKLRAAGIDDFIIVEKTGGISGTWFDNAYPGAACDVPSHLYSFSFAPNPNWSRKFSSAPEIRAYVEKTVEDFDIKKHIHHNTEITSARFDKTQGHWVVKSKTGEIFKARFLMTSVAILGTPQMPDIAGIDTFTGTSFHTARWPKALDIRGKKIAVIGSAASALQIIPEIAKTAAKVCVFQRTANFVIPRHDRRYHKFEKLLFRIFPWTMKLPRFAIFARSDYVFFHNFKSGSYINKKLTKHAHAYRNKTVSDPALNEVLTPNYTMGCKRVLLSDNYFQALQQDNVDVITTPIEKITPRGVATSNSNIDVDIIVYATGFKTSTYLPNLEITGIHGATLAAWRKQPQALRGLVIDNMPNAFFLLGPNTNLGHSSMILMIEAQVKYMVQCVQAVPTNTYFSVKADAVRIYNEDIQKHLAKSVWATGCVSWYKLPDGSIPTMWPHQTSTFTKMMRKFESAEYDFIKIDAP